MEDVVERVTKIELSILGVVWHFDFEVLTEV